MAVVTDYIHMSTEGNTDVIDITPEVSEKLKALKLKKGIVNIWKIVHQEVLVQKWPDQALAEERLGRVYPEPSRTIR